MSARTLFFSRSPLSNIRLDAQGNIHVPEGEEPRITNQPLSTAFDGATGRWMDAVDAVRSGEVDTVTLIGPLSLNRAIPQVVRACLGNRQRGVATVNVDTHVEQGKRVLPDTSKKGEPLVVREGGYQVIVLSKPTGGRAIGQDDSAETGSGDPLFG